MQITKVLMQVTTVELFKFYKNLGDLFAIHSNKKTIRKKAQIPGGMKRNELHSDMCRKYITCSHIVACYYDGRLNKRM